jgi:hypothetical protein
MPVVQARECARTMVVTGTIAGWKAVAAGEADA